jgi:hypothetical protein
MQPYKTNNVSCDNFKLGQECQQSLPEGLQNLLINDDLQGGLTINAGGGTLWRPSGRILYSIRKRKAHCEVERLLPAVTNLRYRNREHQS